MRRNWNAIWMVAQREFQDQFRDWRIIVPMFIMVVLFPFIADNSTRQAINFMNRPVCDPGHWVLSVVIYFDRGA
jgi:ABC-type transport system involved in multi-copper enzyme maturation permease subunit